MALFDKIYDHIDKLPQVVNSTLRETINNTEALEILVGDRQLFDKGEDGKGKRLKGYARSTISLKKKTGLPHDRTTLKQSGKLRESLQAIGGTDELIMRTDVPYDIFLVKRYGPDIFRPSNPNMRFFLDKFFIPKLKENVRK